MRSKLKHNAAFIQLPIGLEKNCSGIVDIIRNEAVYFDGNFGEIMRKDEIPKDMRSEVSDYRHELIEHLSNVDDHLGVLTFFFYFNCVLNLYIEQELCTYLIIKNVLFRRTVS